MLRDRWFRQTLMQPEEDGDSGPYPFATHGPQTRHTRVDFLPDTGLMPLTCSLCQEPKISLSFHSVLFTPFYRLPLILY